MPGPLALEQLVQRRVLGVDGEDLRAGGLGELRSRARRRRPATPCWPARGRCPRPASPPSARGRPSRRAPLSTRSAPDSTTRRTRPSAPASTSPSVHASAARAAASASASAMRRTPCSRAWATRAPTSARPQAHQLQVGSNGHDLERLRSDRPGRAENEEAASHSAPVYGAEFRCDEWIVRDRGTACVHPQGLGFGAISPGPPVLGPSEEPRRRCGGAPSFPSVTSARARRSSDAAR